MVLWCYAVERRANILSASTRNIYELYGQVPQSRISGQQTYVSLYLPLVGMSGYIIEILGKHTQWLLKDLVGV